MATYKLSKEADADLDAILTHGIINHEEERADRYYDGLIRQFESLALNPKLYNERTETNPPVRVCPYGVHVIIYSVSEHSGLFIIRVRHEHEDWL